MLEPVTIQNYHWFTLVDCQCIWGVPGDLLWRAPLLAALGPGSVQVQPPDAHHQCIHQHLHLCDKSKRVKCIFNKTSSVIFYFKRIPSSEQPWKQCCVLSFAGTWHRDCVIVSLSQELKRWSVQAWWYISLSSLSALPHLSLLVFTFNSFILRAYFIHYPILWWKLANNQLPREKIFHICWINCLLLLILWKSMTVVRIV